MVDGGVVGAFVGVWLVGWGWRWRWIECLVVVVHYIVLIGAAGIGIG